MRSHEFNLQENDDIDPKAGEKRDLEIKIIDLKKLSQSIDQQLAKFADLHNITAPTYSIKKKFEKLKDIVKKQILELDDELRRLTVVDKSESTAKINQLLDKIETECSDIVSAIKKTKRFLYRGVKYSPPSFIGRSREDRKSKDSADFSQQVFDVFLKAFGFDAGRGNSIFCSTRPGQASGYGSIYYIFPKNGYEFLYTSNDDLIMGSDYWDNYVNESAAKKFLLELRDWLYNEEPNINDDYYAGEFRELNGYLHDLNNIQDYRFKRLVNDMRRELPMYIVEKLPEKFNLRNPIIYARLLDGNKVFRDLRPNSTDIEHYLENRTGEINIAGVYYALKKSEFARYVEPRLIGTEPTNTDDDEY